MSSYTHTSIPSNYDVKDAFSSTNAPNYTSTSPDYSRYFFPPEDISPPKDTETPVESPIPISPSSSVGSSSPVRFVIKSLLNKIQELKNNKGEGKAGSKEYRRTDS
ncbi:hypothetical protein Tco_0061587 [Tanacetum coccineum]